MYRRGSSWYSDFWYKGERYTESLGPVNKTVAGEKDRAFRAKVASGEYVRDQDDMLFEKAMAEHLKKSQAENQPSTYERNCISAKFLIEHFGGRRISTIEGNQVLMRQYLKKRKEQIAARQIKHGRNITEVTYTSINRELALMRTMFYVLIQAGKAKKNPVSLVTLFEEIQKERVLTVEEEIKILTALDEADKRYSHLKDMVVIALNTAMRQGEILKFEKAWVDMAEGIITVPRHSQKRKKKAKRIPINSALLPVISRLMKQNPGSEYLFVNPKTGTRYTTIQNSWDGILKKAGLFGKAGVDKIRFHDIRHTAATNLARAGMDMKFIAQYLGHADVRTSARYIHYNDEDLKKGAESLVRVPSDFTTGQK